MQMCNLRERAHLKKDYTPQGNPDTLFPGTYYLTGIDSMFRRTYAIKQ
jgi:hydroxymethylglutaryl-CoA synthase